MAAWRSPDSFYQGHTGLWISCEQSVREASTAHLRGWHFMTCHQYSKEIQNFISARTQLERDLLDVNNFFRLEQAAESGEELQATAPDDGKWNERPTPGGKQPQRHNRPRLPGIQLWEIRSRLVPIVAMLFM
jgi:hypothetical protein